MELSEFSKKPKRKGKRESENSGVAPKYGAPIVLLVDDDVAFRKALAFDFKRKGFNVLHACSGDEAWEVVQKSEIHLVITDIRMPNGNGVDLLKRIRARDPKIPPVILITGFTELNLADAKDWGAAAVFTKPFVSKDLLEASKKVLTSPGKA
jgi:DNA-binding response OmpR family regulator